MSASQPVLDRRRSVRIRTLISGRIVYNQKRSSLDCIVRNLSPEGALLRLPDSVSLPEIVELHMPAKQETRLARLRWRQTGSAGLEFVAAEAREVDDPRGIARRMEALEKENARLMARIAQIGRKAGV
jgi:hypothetical protein